MSNNFYHRHAFGKSIQTVFLLWVLSLASIANSKETATDIAGTWKHAEMPVWIEIRLDQGEGIVVRNNKFPEREGQVFIKEIKAKQDAWTGLAYIRKLEAFKTVEITLSDSGTMQLTGKVGFFSRTVEWLPADSTAQE